jgi:hypothetical protein
VHGGDPLELEQPAGERAEQPGLVAPAADAAGDLVDQRLLRELVPAQRLLLVDALRAPAAGRRLDVGTERVQALTARDELQRGDRHARRPLPRLCPHVGSEVGDLRQLGRDAVGHDLDEAVDVREQQPGHRLVGAGQSHVRGSGPWHGGLPFAVPGPGPFRAAFRRKVQNLTSQLV